MISIKKDIVGYPKYSINTVGEVFNNKTGRKLKQSVKKGYCVVFLYNENGRKSFLVHRLVGKAFISNPYNLPEINHKDENPLNNDVSNLEWCTPKYNNNYGKHNEKIRQSMIANNPFKGKQHSEESKQKMKIAKLGKSLSEEHKLKIGQSNKGNGRPGNPVICVELNKVFNSAMDAERQTGVANTGIISVCKGRAKTAGKFHWEYVEKEKIYD